MKSFVVAALIAFSLASIPQLAQAQDGTYPPIQFFSSISRDKLLERLKEDPKFANIDNDALGSPIVLQVRHATRMTAGGSASLMTSAILSGSTLGLIPVVSNDDLVVTYEVLVHGIPIASFEYIENFTDADSLYSSNINELEGDALEWAEATIETFLQDVENDPKLRNLIDEYRYYFADSHL